MSAYCIFDVREITDAAGLDEYVAGVTDTVAAHGGRYLVRGEPFDVVEGDWKPNLLVVIEFPDRAAADAWYDSTAYRPLRELRHRASRCDAVFVGGDVAPSSRD